MTYLSRLITQAVDAEKETNSLGKYSISPAHGVNVYKYEINKEVPHKKFFNYEKKLATLNIDSTSVLIEIDSDTTFKDKCSIVDTIRELYYGHDVDINHV